MPPSQFVFLIDDLPADYHIDAAKYARLHVLERLAGEFRHDRALAFVAVPRTNARFLALLNFQYDLLPPQPDAAAAAAAADATAGAVVAVVAGAAGAAAAAAAAAGAGAAAAAPPPVFAHVSQLATPSLLLYDFDQLRAFEFSGLRDSGGGGGDALAAVAAMHRFVGRALRGDWPALLTLTEPLAQPGAVRRRYAPPASPVRRLASAEELCWGAAPVSE